LEWRGLIWRKRQGVSSLRLALFPGRVAKQKGRPQYAERPSGIKIYSR